MNNADCVICLNFFENESCCGKVEPCSHVFCLKCIQKWTKTSETCPVCRKRIKTINGSQLETSGMEGITRDVISQGQVDVSPRCELCPISLESFGRLECIYCSKRLDRCERCTVALLTNDEEAWSCPSCGQSIPTPSTVGSSFTIKESRYALYQFDDPRATSTNSKENPASSISSNETITYHQVSNLMDRIMEDMNTTHNTPGLTTSPSNEKKLNPGQLEKIKKMVKAALVPHYKNRSITSQEYQRLFDKIVCKVIESGKRLHRPAVKRLAESYILYEKERSPRSLEAHPRRPRGSKSGR